MPTLMGYSASMINSARSHWLPKATLFAQWEATLLAALTSETTGCLLLCDHESEVYAGLLNQV